MDETKDFLTVGEVADKLGVPVSWVYSAVESGKLPSYKIGKYRRIKSSELTAWLNAQREVAFTGKVLR